MIASTATIVLVDDEPMILAGASRALQAAGFAVHTCDAWTEVARLVREAQPDLVLLDYNMPTLKGDQVCTVLKRNLDSSMRIYLYSSEPERDLQAIVQSCGADGYIPKNLAAGEFVRWVSEIIARAGTPV